MAEAPKAKYEEAIAVINEVYPDVEAYLIDWTSSDEGYGIGTHAIEAHVITMNDVVVERVPADYFLEPLNAVVIKMWEL